MLRRYWRSILTVFAAVLALTAMLTLLMPPRYTATSSVFLNVSGASTASELNQGGSYIERQVASYATVATQPVVLDPVIKKLGLQTNAVELAKNISVVSPANTTLLRISATDGRAEAAQQLAHAVATQLVESVSVLSPGQLGRDSLVTATVTDPGAFPTSPSSPKVAQNLALGLVLGLLLGVGQAILRDVLDVRVRTRRDVEVTVGESVLGTVARQGAKRRGYAAYGYAADATEEDFRRLRTNLRFLGFGTTRQPYLVITSADAGEGKTFTSLGLARSVAEAGHRVLLVDADLRRPMVADRTGLDNTIGLGHVLSGQIPPADVINPVQGGFDVMVAGNVPPNPAELLGSPRLLQMLDALRASYDLIILDTAPVLPVTDGVVLASAVGSAVLVARAGTVTRPKLAAAVEAVHNGGGEVLGIVLNGADQAAGSSGYDSYSSRPRAMADAQEVPV